MSEKKSKTLPIILLATGCVAGGALGYTYNKISSSTEYVFAKTGKNIYSETKELSNENKVFSDVLTILDDEYKVGFDSNTDNFGISANYDTVLDSYNFNISLLGLETDFSLDNNPFTIGLDDAVITPTQEALIEELKTEYNQQLITLFLTSETSNLKYVGEEDFDRELIFTIDADQLNLIYTEYTNAIRELLTGEALDEVEITSDGFSFNLKEGLIGNLIKAQIQKFTDEFIQSNFFDSDVIVTLDSKKGIVRKATVDSGDRVLTAYFDPKNLYNSESTINLTTDNFDVTAEITPNFTDTVWTLDLSIYDTASPMDSYNVNYTWDLEATTDNLTITKNNNGEIEEKTYTISGDLTNGIDLKGEKLDFFLEKSLTQ